MAKFTGSSGSLYLNVYIDPGEQNIANNTTIVNWRITVSRSGAYYTYNEQGDSTLSLDLNGGRVHTSNPRWRTSGEEFQMASGSTTVGHNADGTKSFGFSATFNPNNGLHGVITVSGNISLATIPRSSSISFGTGTIGSPLAITINRASSSFTHTLRWAWGSRSGTIASGVTTSASWTIPMDFCNELPNNISGTGTLFVDTYSGSSLIGTQSKTFTANVPSSVIPSFTGITLEDQNAIAKSLLTGNTFVQIMSNIKVTFNGAVGAYGSTIKGFRAEVLNKDIILTSNGGTLGPMNFNGTATIRASVTDSRGRVSATKDVTITLLEYYAPAVSIQVLRTRENPNKLQVLRTIKVAPLTFNNVNRNSTKLVFEVAPLGSASFVVDNGSAGGEWTTIFTLTNSEANLGGTYDSTTSWTVRAKISDKFTASNPTIASATVGTEKVINAYDKDGRFGVGKIPELGPAGSLDVAGNIYAGGKQIQQWALTQGDANRGFGKHLGTTDPDTVIDTGYYWILISQFGDFGQLEVTRFGENEVQQAFTIRNGNRTYRRYRRHDTGVWTPWVAEGIDNFYPIGSIYQSTNNTNPSTFMGGTWERFGNGRVLVGVDEEDSDFNAPNKTGGAKTHTLTIEEMPSHTHPFSGANAYNFVKVEVSSTNGLIASAKTTDAVGGNQAHNNLQPYITVYMWRRTA